MRKGVIILLGFIFFIFPLLMGNSYSMNYNYSVFTDNLGANNTSNNSSVVIIPYKAIGIEIIPVANGIVSIIDRYNFSYEYTGKEFIMNIYTLNASIVIYSIYQISGQATMKQINWNDRDGIYTYYVKFLEDSLLTGVISTNYGQFSFYIQGKNTDTVVISRSLYEKYKALWDGAVERTKEAEQIFGVKFDLTPDGMLHAWDESLDDSRALRQGFQGVALQSLMFLVFLFMIPSNAIIFLSMFLILISITIGYKTTAIKLMKQFKGTLTEKDIIFSSFMSNIRTKRFLAIQRKLKDVALELNIPKQVVKYITKNNRYITLVELYRDFVDSDMKEGDEFIEFVREIINDANMNKEKFIPSKEIPNAIIKFMRHILKNISVEDKDILSIKIKEFQALIHSLYYRDNKSEHLENAEDILRKLKEDTYKR